MSLKENEPIQHSIHSLIELVSRHVRQSVHIIFEQPEYSPATRSKCDMTSHPKSMSVALSSYICSGLFVPLQSRHAGVTSKNQQVWFLEMIRSVKLSEEAKKYHVLQL